MTSKAKKQRAGRPMFGPDVTPAELAAMTTDDVMQVYSGVNGKCCCGCAGEHTYNPKHRRAASVDHGYEIGADQCDAQRVGRVLRQVQREAAKGGSNVMFSSNHVAAVVGRRVHIVYPMAQVAK